MHTNNFTAFPMKPNSSNYAEGKGTCADWLIEERDNMAGLTGERDNRYYH